MGIFSKISEKAGNIVGNERIGELEGEREKEKKAIKPKKKQVKKSKTPKQKKEKVQKETPMAKESGFMSKMFKKKETKQTPRPKMKKDLSDDDLVKQVGSQSQVDEEDISRYIKTDKVGGRTRLMILRELNITEYEALPSGLVTPEQIEAVEFTPTVPSGLSVSEVDSFCDQMEAAIAKYRELLLISNREKNALLDEIIRVERKVVEERNEEVLNSFLEQGSTEKSHLQESLIDSQLVNKELENENKKLREKIALSGSKQGDPLEISELKRTIANLEARLQEAQSNSGEKDSDELIAKLRAAEEQNAKLSRQLNEINSKSEVKLDEESNRELNRLRKENELLKSSNNQSNDKIIQEIKRENEELAQQIKQLSSKSVNTPEDFDKIVMSQFKKQHGSGSKHVKKVMTQDEIEEMKRIQEEDGDIVIDGF